MEADSKKRSKPRLRFNFSNPSETRKAPTIRDDILDSLSRQPQAGQQTIGRSDEIDESGNREQFTQYDDLAVRQAKSVRKRHAGRSALLVFVGGFLAIWAYGFTTRAYDIPGLSILTSTPEAQIGIQVLSANPLQSGLILAGGFLAVLYARHRRKGSKAHQGTNSHQTDYDSGWT